MTIQQENSFDTFDKIMSGSDDDTEVAQPPSSFRARGRETLEFRPVAISAIKGSPPRRPWRRDAPSVTSPTASVSPSPPRPRAPTTPPPKSESRREQHRPSPTSVTASSVDMMTALPKSESKREQRQRRHSKSRKRSKSRSNRAASRKPKPHYPLDGNTPSEQMLACFVCCADRTLDNFEYLCGIQEEMQTINDEIGWCIKWL